MGAIAFYLIAATFDLVMLGMAANAWRRLGSADYARLAAAAGVMLVARVAGLFVLLAGLPDPSALAWLLQTMALAVFAWAFLLKSFASPRPAIAFLAVVAVAAIALFVAGQAGAQLGLPFGWSQRLWPAFLVATSGAGLVLWLRHHRDYAAWLGAAFLLSMLGNAIALVSPFSLATTLTHLAVLVLFVVTTYNAIFADLGAYGRELQDVSEEALRQTREMAFLLEVTQAVAASLDLGIVLQRISESVTLALNANWAYILLSPEPKSTEMSVAACYGWLGRHQARDSQLPGPVTVRVADLPLLGTAMATNVQAVANVPDEYEQFGRLHALLGRSQSGPTLVQPICIQDRPLGALLIGRKGDDRTFDETDRRLCQAIASQVATAIDNARLYQSVDEQARRLAELLRVREEEATQRQAILESIADGVVVAGDAGQVVLANAAAERILGLSREQLIGQAIKRLYAELLRAAGRRMGDQAILQWDDKIVMGSLAPVRMPEGTVLGYVAIFRDVTRERQAEQAKSDFVATISHELRTPMTSIKGYSDLLAGGAVGSVTPQQRRFLEIVRTNSERMISLVNNLIAASEIERGPIEIEARPVDMAEVIAEAVQAVRCQAGERQLDLIVTMPPNLPPVLGDRQRLRQVMDNLLDNAWRYTPDHGRITLWAAEVCQETRSGQPAPCVVINIRDTGVGIRPEDQAHIFDKFFRAENPLSVEAGGTGMGLAIVKGLVEAHGGRVWVESQPGAGSTFGFIVPVAPH